MSSIKQAIVNAIMHVTTDPAYAGRSYETPEAARDDFAKALIAVLFPENPTLESVSVAPVAKKPRAKKAAASAKAADPVVEQLADSLATLTVAEAVETPAAEPKAKNPRAKKAVTAVPVAVEEGSNAAASAPPPEEKEKKARKPKDPDAVKLTAAQVNKAKEIAKTVGVEFDKKAFLAWMGQLTAEERREPLEVMVRTYLSPSAAAPAAPLTEVYKELEKECVSVTFMGEEYWVEVETGKVYKTEMKADGKGEVDTFVGMVGQAKFEQMVVPSE